MLNKASKRTMHCFNSATNVLATAVRSQPSRLDLGNGQGGNWQVFGGKVASGLSLDGNLTLGLPGVMLGMAMGQNMMQTGLQSLFVLLLVLVQSAGGQDFAGVLSALQGQAGEVLVKGDSVG